MLTFRGVEIHEEPYNEANLHFDVRSGFAEPAQVRGEDWVVPGQAGQTRGVWLPDHRIIELSGFVRGTGATLEDRQQSWRASTDALMAVMQFDDEPGALILGPGSNDYLGLETSWTIDAVAFNTIGGPVLSKMTFQAWSIQLKAYDPAWTEVGS